jgi:CobQ/CobB/MinD/ParA nucleotide binding domain
MVANGATRQRTNMKTIVIISQKGGAGKTTVAIHRAVAAEQRGMNTALFDLDPQASASSWSDKRNAPSPAVVSAQAARLPGLLKHAAEQSADLVIIDSAPNADSASLADRRHDGVSPVAVATPMRGQSCCQIVANALVEKPRKSTQVQYWRWESNPHGRSRPEDSKSSASAIPPRRPDGTQAIESGIRSSKTSMKPKP